MEIPKKVQQALPIAAFKGPYSWLSNFYMRTLEWNHRKYKSVEHLYQASKACDEAAHCYVATAKTAREAKQRGREIICRVDWESVKIEVMRNALLMKFVNDDLANKLTQTGNRPLIEGNTWHDNFWGDCQCRRCRDIVGINMLGALLMEIRYKLTLKD